MDHFTPQHLFFKKIHPSVKILLCLGIYQLLYLSRIPASAAVNETVKIAKKITHKGNVGFINAILRGYIRKKKELSLFPRNDNPLLYDSLYWNEPEWLVNGGSLITAGKQRPF